MFPSRAPRPEPADKRGGSEARRMIHQEHRLTSAICGTENMVRQPYALSRSLHRLNLLPEYVLQSHGVSSKLADTLAELVYSHWRLVEVEAERRLVVDERLLLDVQTACILRL